VPADLSDPVLAGGPEGYPAGVTREYYAFVETSLDKIPVVLSDPPALKLSRQQLSGYWQDVLGQSRGQAPVIRLEMFQGGRVVDHKSIDYRSPVFGVASLSYSRAVTAIAATWLAVWREARGDMTRMRDPRTVAPRTSTETAATPEVSPP
jgi:ribosome modulation factor